MTDDQRSELQAIRARAGVAEAARQAALQHGDRQRVAMLEDELRALCRRHAELEQRCVG